MPTKKPKAPPKIRYISPDMLWDAPQAARSEKKDGRGSQGSIDTSNAPGASRDLPDRFQGADGRWHWTAKGYKKWAEQQRIKRAQRDLESEEEHKRIQAERILARAAICPFCDRPKETHPEGGDCPEYLRMVREAMARRGPIRPGIPWAWVVEHYAKQGKTPPGKRTDYD